MKAESQTRLNEEWRQRILSKGADFVCFVDVSEFPEEVIDGCTCAVLFGKALSGEYIAALRAERKPKHNEVLNTEAKMDALAVMLAEQLEAEGYKSIAKLKVGRLPHKSVALRAGLGFIGKNNLLVTPEYGCALMLGKVLTTAPFATLCQSPMMPQCGDCSVCVDVCPNRALLGKTWSLETTRDEIMTRRLCTLCLKCMIYCPYTEKYANDNDLPLTSER